MNRCPQCFGPNDDVNYSHLCHACLVALEPTPQGANGVTGKADAAPAVVGLEPVAFMTHHDEPMLFPTWDEAAQYCDDDESPISLFHTADVARLQSELTEWRGQAHRSQSDADRLQAENEHLRGSIEVLRDRIENNRFLELETENEEQARLLGISGSREAKLLEKIAAYAQHEHREMLSAKMLADKAAELRARK